MIEFEVCLPEYTKEQQKLEKGSGGRNGKTNTFFLSNMSIFSFIFISFTYTGKDMFEFCLFLL